jgi:hypothetical protein
MTSRKDFTDEEWIRIRRRRAPFVAGFAISIADPGLSTPVEFLVSSFQPTSTYARAGRRRIDLANS